MKLSDVVAPSTIDDAPKDLLMVGGARTVSVAVEVLPVPPLVEVTVTLLLLIPEVIPVTFTSTLQFELAGTVPPDRLQDDAPTVAVAVPPQRSASCGLEAMMRPAGRVSVNATPVRAVALGLTMMTCSDVVPFNGIVAAPKVLTILGGERV